MSFTFSTSISNDGWIGSVIIPDDIAAQLTALKIKRVVALISANDVELKLHAGVIKRKGVLYLMLSKANRKRLQVQEGDTVLVQMNKDTSKYQAPMTEELEAVLLSDYEAYEIFENMLPGKQRNLIFLIYGIAESQKRVDVALNAMENLKRGNLNPMRFEKILPY